MSHSLRKPVVLVADDDEALRQAVAVVLSEAGFDIALASNGERTLEALDHGARPAVVLLDLMMPGVTGWEVLDLMQQRADLADIPVIVLTAHGAQPGLPAGCRVLHKPFEREVLLAELRALTVDAA